MPIDSLFHGPNAGYVIELYERYCANPESVDPATRAFFAQWSPEETAAVAVATPPPAAPPTIAPQAAPDIDLSKAHIGPPLPIDITHTVAAARLIRSIRELGHLAARIDPLGSDPPGDPSLDAAGHDLTEADLALLPASIVRGPLAAESRNALEGVQKLRAAYCGTIGYETSHVQVFEEREWIREAVESRRFFYGFDSVRKRELLERLTEVETFERYLHQTFVGQKRFSIEGCDMLIPIIDSIIRNAAVSGVREVVIGMAHRGRLNVLAHILGKPYSAILSEFLTTGRDAALPPAGRGAAGWVGDVKYHLGARRAFREAGIEQMPITLAPNPSHLEFVNPVVAGRARAAQEQCDRPGPPLQDKRASLPILIHGDAAFPGQGIVAETLNLANLAGYSTGGTIHIIVNNQIGFTTSPREGRSTLYASDLAKGFEIPIVHVNADDVEGCIAVARMAYAYRERFGKDFLIDLVGYRRWGHNEGDEPAFTQPTMYAAIARHPTVREQWAAKLIAEGVVSADEANQMITTVWERLQQARSEAEARPHFEEPPPLPPPGIARRTNTAVPAERLVALNEALLQWPPGFRVHPRLERMLERRRTALHMPDAIDWAHAEILAFASLLEEGIPIRLTGQDVERGTFSQRHLVLHDVQTDERWCALQALPQARASFAVYNSPLSEAAALGFEFGYSAHKPQALVIWEAQFGDFANGAQVIIDQFIVSARKKWGQTPALVMLLPHGYEGQGPEHSSARLERFLQLAAEDNIRVANCTTAAQYFHLLRRQALLLNADPRPLIIMTPKSLLRHPRAASSLRDLSEGRFQRVIDDPQARERPADVARLVLCSGKIYVDLLSASDTPLTNGIAVVRLEELYSFPADELRDVLAGYPNLQEVVWLQEEPENMGAWRYVAPRLRELIGPDLTLSYIGRPESASPAEGSLALHLIEQQRLIAEALRAPAVERCR
ncbi:MAG: 2-oxoglutarate dehydrogenase E1 component [Roseiflexus sp.]|nr:2-oxoglutarate dehydrogenase E1 component [Roseiflexus sp.]MCS7289966.1 2-oxoglutarate dehydrogenase E1 component [Roseiflexus sp.]MDW8233320.1 2-oxoglutarate dehydrogenase E1 component [Roseiflexaceae bacterium]